MGKGKRKYSENDVPTYKELRKMFGRRSERDRAFDAKVEKILEESVPAFSRISVPKTLSPEKIETQRSDGGNFRAGFGAGIGAYRGFQRGFSHRRKRHVGRQKAGYAYDSFPAALIRPEQIFVPGATDVLGPIATSRKLFCDGSCPSSIIQPPRKREVKLGAAVGLFPQPRL